MALDNARLRRAQKTAYLALSDCGSRCPPHAELQKLNETVAFWIVGTRRKAGVALGP